MGICHYRDATVTTEATWTPDAEHRLDLTYRTFVSRAQQNLAVQQLTVTPQFSGPITVTDLIDGAAARRVTPTTAASDPNRGQTAVGVRAVGTDRTAVRDVDKSKHAADRIAGAGAG